jgi:hypothetical protein
MKMTIEQEIANMVDSKYKPRGVLMPIVVGVSMLCVFYYLFASIINAPPSLTASIVGTPSSTANVRTERMWPKMTVEILEIRPHRYSSGTLGDTELLLAIENASPSGYAYADWSCTFWLADKPVAEKRFTVENVPATSRIIHEEWFQNIEWHPNRKATCRLIKAVD